MPPSQEPELCTWVDFSLTDIEKLLHCSSNSECVREAFCQKLELEAVGNKQHRILLDLYTYTLFFGQKQNCTPIQLSTLLSIVKRLHAKCTSTALDNQDEVLAFFQETMVKHSVNRPPFSLSIFSPCQVKTITEYVLSTYFKHFKLYKYAFTKRLQLNVALDYADENEKREELKQTNIVPEGGIETDANIETDTQVSEVTQLTDQIGPTVSTEDQAEQVEPTKLQLKEFISSKLNNFVKQQQVKLQTELMAQESRLQDRITVLERTLVGKGGSTTSSGKKRSGKTH